MKQTTLTLKCHLEQLFILVVVCLVASGIAFLAEILIHKSQVENTKGDIRMLFYWIIVGCLRVSQSA